MLVPKVTEPGWVGAEVPAVGQFGSWWAQDAEAAPPTKPRAPMRIDSLPSPPPPGTQVA